VASGEIAAQILAGGAALWGFTDEDFAKADAAMERLRGRRQDTAEPAGVR
jgi:hypothetical protein